MLLPSYLDGDKNCRSSKARQAESEPRKTKGQEERPAKEEKLSKHKLVGNQNEARGEVRHVNGHWANSVRILWEWR